MILFLYELRWRALACLCIFQNASLAYGLSRGNPLLGKPSHVTRGRHTSCTQGPNVISLKVLQLVMHKPVLFPTAHRRPSAPYLTCSPSSSFKSTISSSNSSSSSYRSVLLRGLVIRPECRIKGRNSASFSCGESLSIGQGDAEFAFGLQPRMLRAG